MLDALGGRGNVLSNAVCMTRLRVTLSEPGNVDYEQLGDVHGVLGTATRGNNGLEVVFGPRVIDGIYHAFIRLTGIAGRADDLFPMSRQDSNMRVHIRTKKSSRKPPQSTSDEPLINANEMSMLESMFGSQDTGVRRLLVINGPNINLLGMPSTTSDEASSDYPTLLELCKQSASEVGFQRCDCYQSNHEGDLVDKVQDAYDIYDAIVINPGAYGSSLALRDALRAVSIPALEVSLNSQIETDMVGTTCVNTIAGQGIEGYRTAVRAAWNACEDAAGRK